MLEEKIFERRLKGSPDSTFLGSISASAFMGSKADP